MKRAIHIALVSLSMFFLADVAAAQPLNGSASQSVTLSFPERAALAITGGALTLEVQNVDPTTGTWQTATNTTPVTLYQINNYASAGTRLKVQAQLDVTEPLPTGLTLSLTAGGPGGLSNVNLSDELAHDIVRDLVAGPTSHALTYALSATSSATTYTVNSATVTYTVTQQ